MGEEDTVCAVKVRERFVNDAMQEILLFCWGKTWTVVSFVNYFNGIINKIEKHRLFFLCYNGKRLKIQQDIVGKKGKKK